MHKTPGALDQPRDLLLAEHRGQALLALGKWDLIGYVSPAKRLHKQEPQRCSLPFNGAGRELAITKQMNLVLTDVVRSKLIRGTVKVRRERLHSVHVGTIVCGK